MCESDKALRKKTENYTINKKVEKQSHIIQEIDCTTSNNEVNYWFNTSI